MRENKTDIQIIVLMAGRGLRVQKSLPKPLVEIHGMPLYEIVTKNLTSPEISTHFIYVCREEDCEKFGLEKKLKSLVPDCSIIKLDLITDGAARSALMAEKYLDLEKPVLIANSDQLFLYPSTKFYDYAQNSHVDGLIMSMGASGPKWSYVQADDKGRVSLVREKVQISNIATVGIYYFKKAKDFIDSTKKMIEKDIRTNGEFYLAPVYNEMIESGKNIFHCYVGDQSQNVFGLGTNEDIEHFENLKNSKDYIRGLA